ncbi:MAG: formate dehydrogenase subunit gamma [Caulobacterales bacterium]
MSQTADQGPAKASPVLWSEARAAEIIAAHADRPGALLPILQALQAEFGWISDEAAALAAERLNLSRAEVHGALTFYHDFRRAPAGRHVLKLCRAEACQARGGRQVEARTRAALGVGIGETTSDGAVTLEAVYCLGLCASGPAALLDERPVARLAGERLERLLAEARA